MKFWVIDPWAIRSIVDSERKGLLVPGRWSVQTSVYGFYQSAGGKSF